MKPHENYNMITDTVAGPNIRVRDNVFQAVFIFVCAVLGAAVGWLGFGSTADPKVAALIGGIIGMVAGLFISGIALMIYRAVRHGQGKHD